MSTALNQFGMPNKNYAQPARPTAPPPGPVGRPAAPQAPVNSTNTSVTANGQVNTALPPDQAILSLLQGGMSPQQASDAVNAQDPFAKALYYGNNNTIGLPSSYLSFDNGAWDITKRGPGGGSAQTSGTPGGPGAALFNQALQMGQNDNSDFSQGILQKALGGIGAPQAPQAPTPPGQFGAIRNRVGPPTPGRQGLMSPLMSALTGLH